MQSQTGEPTGSAASVEHKGPVFYFSHEDTLYLDPNLISSLTLTLHRPLYPDSTLQIQLQYIDDGAWRRGPVTRPFDTRFVFGSDIRKRGGSYLSFLIARTRADHVWHISTRNKTHRNTTVATRFRIRHAAVRYHQGVRPAGQMSLDEPAHRRAPARH